MNFELECHITSSKDHEEQLKLIAEELHWKYSAIDGDPVLGQQVYAYLTTHDRNVKRMVGRMEECAAKMREGGIPVIREKIEAIIMDTKKDVSLNLHQFEGEPTVCIIGAQQDPLKAVIESRESFEPKTTLAPNAAWPFPTGRKNGD